jgi:hypothetical protein
VRGKNFDLGMGLEMMKNLGLGSRKEIKMVMVKQMVK